jgi:hypothetical protein
MNTSLALAFILGHNGSFFKVPVYSADQKNPAVMGYVSTTLPAGFAESGKFGSGAIKSDDGTITVTLLKSSAPMPSLLRNPKFSHLKDFTTIRMTNWIGFRNSNPKGEDYKLDWSNYRLNFNLLAKDKQKVDALREALHTIVDGVELKR